MLQASGDLFWINAYQKVPPTLDGLYPLRFRAQSQTGNRKEKSFLLNPPGIGEDHPGILFQDQHVKIIDWIKRCRSNHTLSSSAEYVDGLEKLQFH